MSFSFSLADTAQTLESDIRANRILDLDVAWADELVYPYYDGLALPNIPQQIAHWLGSDYYGDQRLDMRVWGGTDLGDIDRVILYISDGFGYLWYQQLLEQAEGFAETIADLTDGRGAVPLTSTAPSTTAVALPTLWTGVHPQTHGMLGSLLWLKELSMLSKMLHFAPVAGRGKVKSGVFDEWGFSPEDFVSEPRLAQILTDVGAETYLYQHRSLINTGLSRIMHTGIQHHVPHHGYSDMWLGLENLLTETRGKKTYISIYNPAVDTLSHAYGAHGDHLQHEIVTQYANLQRVLNNPAIQDGRTMVLMMADHGHHAISHKLSVHTDERAQPIWDAMRSGAGAEARLAYLYLQAGKTQQILDTVAQEFSDCLATVTGEDALAKDLFGTGKLHPYAQNRIGDVLLIPRLGTFIEDHMRSKHPLSRHGGLSDWEMLVPLMWKRL